MTRVSRETLSYLVVVGVLVVALVLVAVLVWLPVLRKEAPAPAGSGFEFITDIDNWRQTDQGRVVTTDYDFALSADLKALPTQLGRWAGADIEQTNLEVFILLEPEQYVYRRYEDDQGHILWLSLIGSRQSKSFHPPQICYSADGWRTQVSSVNLELAEGQIHALRLDGTKDGQQHLVLYFYLWPDRSRDFVQGTVLFKMTVPLVGADADPAAGLALAQDFVQQVFSRSAPL